PGPPVVPPELRTAHRRDEQVEVAIVIGIAHGERASGVRSGRKHQPAFGRLLPAASETPKDPERSRPCRSDEIGATVAVDIRDRGAGPPLRGRNASTL